MDPLILSILFSENKILTCKIQDKIQILRNELAAVQNQKQLIKESLSELEAYSPTRISSLVLTDAKILENNNNDIPCSFPSEYRQAGKPRPLRVLDHRDLDNGYAKPAYYWDHPRKNGANKAHAMNFRKE